MKMERTIDIITCVWNHAPEGYDEPITLEQADAIISSLTEDDRFVAPDDMTPELVRSIWNELVEQYIADNT